MTYGEDFFQHQITTYLRISDVIIIDTFKKKEHDNILTLFRPGFFTV